MVFFSHMCFGFFSGVVGLCFGVFGPVFCADPLCGLSGVLVGWSSVGVLEALLVIVFGFS